MKFYVEIDTDNSAFEDGDELSNRLKDLVAEMRGYRSNHPANQKPQRHVIRDSNGNTCGFYGFE